MDDTKKDNPTTAPASVKAPAPSAETRPALRGRGGHGGRGGAGAQGRGGRPFRGGRGGRERVRSEFDNKIIAIRRVARVVSGGRRFSFSVALVAGDKKGSVGVGLGKAGDTALAIEKATNNAKKNMMTIPLTKEGSLRHEVEAKWGPSVVMVRPARGRGLVAGSAVRTVLEFAGVRDVSARIISRSKNRLNNARATIAALSQIEGAVPRRASRSSAGKQDGGKPQVRK